MKHYLKEPDRYWSKALVDNICFLFVYFFQAYVVSLSLYFVMFFYYTITLNYFLHFLNYQMSVITSSTHMDLHQFPSEQLPESIYLLIHCRNCIDTSNQKLHRQDNHYPYPHIAIYNIFLFG